jgi:hypothetical protein
MSAEATEAWHGAAALHGGVEAAAAVLQRSGTPFVAEAYIASVLDYIFKRRSSLEELGVCRWRSSAYVAEEENGGRSSGHGDDNDGSCNHSGDASQD